MSLIIEILPWGREAVSIVWVGALVGIDAGQPSDTDWSCGGGRLCALHLPGTKLGLRGFIVGLRPYLLSIPCAAAAGQSVAFCPLGPWRYVLCTSSNWSTNIQFDLGSPCHATIFITGMDHRYSRTSSARCLRMPPWH